ncbi:uncharacterized protein (TIGR00369 family) [Kribbella sp. VKM Ac-2571]|uniref:PaaI family thioesterase n=1 Tax=Kribbella sp. VKM Ac-2571 TaxID=2512222 RepID=UPI00105F04AC|nr:PaaI family thioesterase [Kribbella sp. VKM Ac-2571]TDO56647.1 uncharacterized protein (TIGR00369 family) [Kribbella sp. VKM Ac-2571]
MDSALNLTMEDAARVLDAQPFSRLLGCRITEFRQGAATLELPNHDDLRQQDGFVHGGALAYLADNAITFAAGSVLGARVLTAGVSIDYLRPATGDVVATASVVGRTGRTAVCTAILVSRGSTCAVAHGSARLIER